ncbi:MAG: hypothetical protein QM504_16460 [Pseudomonadota bacterium]
MKLKTLTFKNKTASVVWMLILALSLVLVDFFLAPVVAENGWLFEELKDVKKIEKTNESMLATAKCRTKIESYLLKNNNGKYAAQACFSQGDIILLKASTYKGEIFIYHQNKTNRIAMNLKSPKVVAINSDREIFIQEQGRKRVLKFWKK